jgi:hypothetical protein
MRSTQAAGWPNTGFQPTAWACGWERSLVKTAAAEPGRWDDTDPRGIATFFVGSNCTYMLWVDAYTLYWLEWDVTIEPGEVQRRVYQYPFAGIKR